MLKKSLVDGSERVDVRLWHYIDPTVGSAFEMQVAHENLGESLAGLLFHPVKK